MENDEKGLRRYSIRLPAGEATIEASALNFDTVDRGVWASNVNGTGMTKYLIGVIEADVRDLTAGEEPWGHDENAAEGFEPETFPAVVAFVERGGKSGLARVEALSAVGWLRLHGWIVSAAWNGSAALAHRLWHPELAVQLAGLGEQDVDEVARLMGWQG